MDLSSQFSAYDERPDQKKPGQQGVLFRKVAPARNDEPGSQLQGARYQEKSPNTGNATGYLGYGQDLYHGTSSTKKPGERITPGRASNWMTTMGRMTRDTKSQRVYATNDLEQAYHFAMRSARQRGGRPQVYTVKPTGPMQVDEENRPPEGWNPNISDDQFGGWDAEDDYEPKNFQSYKPLRITGRVPIREARDEYETNNGTHVQSWLDF